MGRFFEAAAAGAILISPFASSGCSGDDTSIGNPKPPCTVTNDLAKQTGTVLLTNVALEDPNTFNERVRQELEEPIGRTVVASCTHLPAVKQLIEAGISGKYEPIVVNASGVTDETVVCAVAGIMGDFALGNLVLATGPNDEPRFELSC